MRQMYVLFITLVVFCFVSATSLYAIDPGDCEYIDDDDPQVDGLGYIMSWLILDPYISDTTQLSGPSCNKDYFEDQGGEANIKPREGDTVKIAETKSEHVWARLNFADLKDMGQIPAAVGGNEFDILCWGGQGPTNTQEYLVTYLKWKTDTKVKFTVGVDDASELYFNGDLLISDPNSSQNWAAGNSGSAEANVKGGVWNILVVGCYESAGEWGITVQVAPVPDEVNNVGPLELFAVDPQLKLSSTWGQIKMR